MSEKVDSEQEKLLLSQQPRGQCLILQMSDTGLLTRHYWHNDSFLADRFQRKIISETKWFENIIHHAPTVGSFYENLIRNTLKEFAPSSNKIGTGFIYDSSRHEHGKQIDILVYDDNDRSVIYRCDEFVVINPASVISTTEVKKTLSATTLKDVVRSTFFNNMGGNYKNLKNIQKLNLFTYKLTCKKEHLFKTLVDVLQECINKFRMRHVTTNEEIHALVSHCVLPDLFFLEDEFYITTDLVPTDKGGFKVRVVLHETIRSESLGIFLSHAIREDKTLIDRHEHNYLFNPISPLPEHDMDCFLESEISLIDIVDYSDLLNIFPNDINSIIELRYKDLKPLAVFIPKNIKINSFTSFNDFLQRSNSTIQFFNNDDPVMVASKVLQI